MSREYYFLLSARRNYLAEFGETAKDFKSTFSQWRLGLALALHDIASRYRGSIIGPWWITITMGAVVFGIGFNYAALFHVSVRELLPYVAVGIVMWGFISSCIAEGADAFVGGGAMLRQSALPLPLFQLRTIFRNVINLGHHMIIIVLVLAYVAYFPGVSLLWSLLGFVLLVLNVSWIMMLSAFLSTRFRDVPQVIAALLQVTFFVTPVFWKVNDAVRNSPMVLWNPFYYMLECIRAPMIGVQPALGFYAINASMAVCGWIAAILIYNQTRRRVVHYL